MKKKKKDNEEKTDDYDLYKSLNSLSEQLSKEGFALTPEELGDIKHQISQELSFHKSIKEIKDNTDGIVHYLAEYFDTFILLGYDSKGERIVINFFDTPLKQDAIFKLLEQIFIKNIQRVRNGDDPTNVDF